VEAAQFVREGGEFALPREGIGALAFEGVFPGADEVSVEAEGAGGLGEGVALLGHELDGLGLEFRSVDASFSCHAGPPRVSRHP